MNASQYIQHHLQSLQYDLVHNQMGSAGGFWTLNLDTLIVSWVLGLVFLVSFIFAARKMTSGVPGRWQNCVETMVEFVNGQVKHAINETDRCVEYIVLKIFLWVFLMNFMDLLHVDLLL